MTGISFSPDSKRIASTARDGMLQMWDVEKRSPIWINIKKGDPGRIAFSADGSIMAVARDHELRLLEADTGESIRAVDTLPTSNLRAIFSPDNETLIWTGKDIKGLEAQQKIELWNRDGTARSRVIKDDDVHFDCELSVSPDGKWFASGNYRGITALWTMKTAEKVAVFKGEHEEGAERDTRLAFGFDSKSLVAVSRDGTVRVWEVESKKKRFELKHDHYAISVACHPKLPLFATTGGKPRVQLWDSVTGKPVAALDVDGYHQVSCVAFSPDGKYIATAGEDTAIRVWLVDDVIKAGAK